MTFHDAMKSPGIPARGALPARTAQWILAVTTAMLLAGGDPREAGAIAQRVGDFELEIDAPWRIEPRSDPSSAACTSQLGCGPNYVYDAIPIQVSIHDADQPSDTASTLLQQLITKYQTGIPWYDVLFTFVTKVVAKVVEGLDDALELVFGVEVLPFDGFPRKVTLQRFVSLSVAEKVNGVYVTRAVLDINGLHEVEQTVGLWQWAANQTGPESTTAPPPRPTHSLCRRWQGESCTGLENVRPTSEWHAIALYQPYGRQVGKDVRLRVDLRMDTLYDADPVSRIFRRYLNVHLGDAPLPRFDERWAYGDLHYHSQGTDNDGESAYSYRGVLHAMSALGLDFAFATDHASNSRQIGSAVPIVSPALIQPLFRGLRDLSPDRFAFDLDLLNAPVGANRQVVSYPRRRSGFGVLAAPALFLGAEVDVVPEIDPTSYEYDGIIPCVELPGLLKALQQRTPFPDDYWCGSMTVPTPDGRHLLRDVQGPDGLDFLSTRFYGRQHLLHLPVDPARHDAFIASNTSKYGGATRRLRTILNVELGQHAKGYAFLAHPFARSHGSDFGRVGPDLAPFSEAQLRDAFASPHVLGLQIWNENGLRSASANDLTPFPAPNWKEQHPQRGRLRDVGRWDEILLWGLDRTRTASLTWLGPDEPRRMFIAGGSDAHGDLNFRRSGYFFGTESVNETALGTPRNLVFAGPPEGQLLSVPGATGRPFSQQQIVAALQEGTFSVTDGPAVRIAYDVNGNKVIDDRDVPMGGVARPTSDCGFNVVVEWKSTPEFAGVAQIDLYLGVFADELPEGMVYQAWRAPASNPSLAPSAIGGATTFVDEASGKSYTRTPNHPYWYDPTETTLRITPALGEQFEGRRIVRIRPHDFPVGEGFCIRDTPPEVASGSKTGSAPIGGTKVTTPRPFDDFYHNEGGLADPSGECDRMVFANKTRPDRFYVRAEVKNGHAPGSNLACVAAPYDNGVAFDEQVECIHRQAYSNPVWVSLASATPGLCQIAIGPLPVDPGLTF